MSRFVVYLKEEPKINDEVDAENKSEAIRKFVFQKNRGERGIPYVKSDYNAIKISDEYEHLEDLIDYLAYNLKEETEPEFKERAQKLFAFAVGLRKLWVTCENCGRRINPTEDRVITQTPYPDAVICLQCRTNLQIE